MRKEISSSNSNNRGQSLVELIIGISISTILIGASAGAAAIILRSNVQSKRLQAATTLAQELSDNLRSFTEAGWLNIYNLQKGSSHTYYLNTATSPFTASAANSTETLTQENVNYIRSFYVDDVNRAGCGTGDVTTNATTSCRWGSGTLSDVAADPSTEKVTIVVTWPDTTTGVKVIEYLTRAGSIVFRQTNWVAGAGQENFPATGVNSQFASSTVAADPIRAVDYTSVPGSIKVNGF